LTEGKKPQKDTTLIIAPTGLEVQLFFLPDIAIGEARKVKESLLRENYVGIVMDSEELKTRGAAVDFADMLVSPKPPYCFKNDNKLHRAGGQHDSLDETSQHVFALMWGEGIQKGYTCEEKVFIIDFAKTIAALAGIDPPRDATGRLLREVLE
jgi:hypothetical protein